MSTNFLFSLLVFFVGTNSYGSYYPQLPGLERFSPKPNLYFLKDFPGQNGVPSQFAYKKLTVDIWLYGTKITLGYVECGETLVNVRPMIFIHGEPTYSYEWRNVMPHVCDQVHAIAIDLPGFGRSDKRFGFPDLEFFIDVVEKFIQALQLQNIVFVLHDWGASFGYGYILRNEANVDGLVIFESLGDEWPPLDNFPEPFGPFFQAITSETIGDAAFNLLVQDLFFVNSLYDSLLLFPTEEVLCGYLAQFVRGYPDLQERFIQFLLPQCAPIPGLIGAGNSLFGQCRQDQLDIWTAFENIFANSQIPKLILFPTPGTFLTPILQDAVNTLNPLNTTTSQFGAGIHYLAEDNPIRLGTLISHWLAQTGLGPVNF